MTEAPDPYKILQVDPEAEDEVIQAAYRRLAQKYHPDLSIGQAAIDRMVAINAAWETIGDPTRRASYDLAQRAARAKSAGTAPDAEREGSARGAPAGGAGTRPADAGSSEGGASGRGPSPTAAAGPTGPSPASAPRPTPPRSPDTGSRDWTPGRSTTGSGYDAKTMRAPEGHGGAGPPPGNPSGSVLTFGRYAGWSLGEVGRRDLEYLEWLDRMPIGRPYRDEIDALLRASGRRRSAGDDTQRRGLFRRR